MKTPTSRWLRYAYLIVLFSLWGALIASLLKRNYGRTANTIKLISLETGIREIPSDSEWMTIYHQGKKLGYAIFSLQNRGTEGYTPTTTTRLKAALAGFENEVLLYSWARVDTAFQLDNFNFQLTSDQFQMRLRGVRKDSLLVVDLFLGEDSTRREITLPEAAYTFLGIKPMIARQGIQAGERLVIPAFDPVSMDMAEVEIVHEGKETRTIGGQRMSLNKIRISFQGIPSYLWLDDNGLTYREESIMGLVMERTTPDEALQTDQLAGGLDLINAYAIPVDQPIENPGDLTELTIELEGLEPHYLQALNSPRQEVLSTDPLQLRLQPIPVPGDSTKLKTYLVATPTIQSTHPKIQAICSLYNEGHYSNAEKTQLLRRWVYKYLKKRPVVTLATASKIVERRVGDCSEHTILFTALTRGLGIPTKIHVGLVYLQGRFLYHAWPVVYLEQQWVAVDPTLDQPIADATHIALLESEFTNLYQLIPILGRISIRIINQQYGKPTS